MCELALTARGNALTSAQTATFVTLLAALICLFLLVILGAPCLARLLFLHRLEVIRDDCMDAVLDDRLREAPSVELFLKVTETGAALPRQLTPPHLYAASRVIVDAGIDIADLAPPPTYEDLGPDERGIMDELDKRMRMAYTAYLKWGSPASWILRPLVFLASRIHPGSDLAKTKVALPDVARETLQEAPAQQEKSEKSSGLPALLCLAHTSSRAGKA